jgi:Protein of unknown function, DUF583.
MSIGDIIRPDEDLVIGHEFSGSIRCRTLTVLEGGSVSGAVVAEHVEVRGSLSGVVDCEHFVATPTAVIRGTIFAPNCVTCDNNGAACDCLVLHSTKRQSIFHKEEVSGPALQYEEIIHSAIDEVVSKRLRGAVDTTSSQVATTEEQVDSNGDLSLLERLASKGLTSLLPVESEPESAAEPGAVAQTESASARPVTSLRTPLPSLV